jgi:hypothetical protein
VGREFKGVRTFLFEPFLDARDLKLARAMRLISAVKLISPIVVCVALSACATDYGSQLAEPNYGRHGMHYTEGNVDPTMLMNGTYASKQLNGPSIPLGAFCFTDYRCSPQSQLWSSGWAP